MANDNEKIVAQKITTYFFDTLLSPQLAQLKCEQDCKICILLLIEKERGREECVYSNYNIQLQRGKRESPIKAFTVDTVTNRCDKYLHKQTANKS